MRRIKVAALAGAVTLATLTAVIPAVASTGVAIDVSKIAVSQELRAGDAYRLPAFGVRNPGTEPTTYDLTVSYIADAAALQPPESWFEFAPGRITLDPATTRAVITRLTIPPDAEPGTYEALIGPQISSDATGAQVGAAAAARLSFTVVPSSALDAWLRWLGRFLAENPWVLLIPAAIALAGAWWFVRRRYAFSIARR